MIKRTRVLVTGDARVSMRMDTIDNVIRNHIAPEYDMVVYGGATGGFEAAVHDYAQSSSRTCIIVTVAGARGVSDEHASLVEMSKLADVAIIFTFEGDYGGKLFVKGLINTYVHDVQRL